MTETKGYFGQFGGSFVPEPIQNLLDQLEATFEQIDKLPETTLSDDEKTLLKGMMGDLNTKDKSKRGSKLDKLLSWLAGKGTDVFIAAMPYIVQLIKSQLS